MDLKNLELSDKGLYKYIGIYLFLLYPLSSLPFIIKGILEQKPWAYCLAAIFMGYLGVLYPPTGDMYRYASDFNLYKELDWESFWIFMALKFDYFLPLLSWCLGKLNCHPDIVRFIFVSVSYFILFYIYHNIISINENVSFKLKVYTLFLIVPLTFYIYLFRMGFATTFFLLGAYLYFIRGHHKGVIFIILAAFIHVSFIPFVLITLVSRIKFFNFSNKTFLILCFLLFFVESSPIGVYILQALPVSASLADHIEEYISGSASEVSVLSFYQILANMLYNLIFYITLYIYYLFYKNNPQPLYIKRFINILLIVIILSASVPVLYARLLSILKIFLLLVVIYYYLRDRSGTKWINVIFMITILSTMLSLWQARFYIKYGLYERLFTSSSIGLVTFHYSDKWIEENVDSEGFLIEWQKTGYTP